MSVASRANWAANFVVTVSFLTLLSAPELRGMRHLRRTGPGSSKLRVAAA